VSIVNLTGRAFHVEDDGVAALDAWLADARRRLEPDPDREELLADFERAIADKCDVHVGADRDVVTAEQVRSVLDSLGTVELPAGDADAATEPQPAALPPLRERHLYRLTGEGEGKLAGVCAGLAAYLNIDVTVVRVLFVIAALSTSGIGLIAYIILAIVVPEADSPDKRAAVRGYGETAQELMSRARDGARPALASLGAFLRHAWAVLTGIVRWALLAVSWAVLALWLCAAIWVLTDGSGLLDAFDAGTSRWIVALWVTSVAWLVVSLTFGLATLLRRLTPGSASRARGRDGVPAGLVGGVWAASVVVAAFAAVMIPLGNSTPLRGLSDGQGRIELLGETYCFQDPANPDEPTERERCHDGDHVVD
jgi:phage shock protein PspC (stress-responsive transcriptional regulator)